MPFNCVVLCSSCSLLIGLGLRMSDERRLLSSQASRALRIPKGSLKVSQGIIHVFLALCLGLLLIESKVYELLCTTTIIQDVVVTYSYKRRMSVAVKYRSTGEQNIRGLTLCMAGFWFHQYISG